MSPYHLRNNNSFKRSGINSVLHSTELVSYLSPKIWDFVLNELKNLNLSILSNSKSKGGSLKDVHVEYAKYIYDNIKIWFSVK